MNVNSNNDNEKTVKKLEGSLRDLAESNKRPN